MNPAWPARDYDAIIFDCDGTLTDSMPVHYVAWYHVMQSYGVEFPVDRFYSLGGMPSQKIIALLSAEQGKTVDLPTAADKKEDAFLQLIDLIEPVGWVLEVANHFKDRLPVAVASGGYRKIIDLQLKQLGIQEWFRAIVTAEDTERHKPEPDVFLEAASRLGVNPAKCLVYEDADLGVQAAQSAGMDCIDVRAFHTPRTLNPADYQI